MKKILILVEGQTEEMFVKTVLNPHLESGGGCAIPKIVATKFVKRGTQFKGGIPAYDRVRPQIMRLLNDSSAVSVTTFIDYYALPESFPGKKTIVGSTPIERVKHLEEQLLLDIGDTRRFVPYYSLHEFEALLFASPGIIAETLTLPEKVKDLSLICSQFPSPEDINDNPDTCPSARLRTLFEDYQKTLHGSLITKRIGLSIIRQKCAHFNEWLTLLERM